MEHAFDCRRGDVALTLRGEPAWVEAMVARYLPVLLGTPGSDPAPALPDPPQRAPQVTKNITLLDFVRLKEVSEPADLVLALAYYLEKYEYLPNYDLSDLQPYYGELELDDATVTRALRHHTQLSLLVEDGGRYSLSYSGEQRVKYGDFPEGPGPG